MNHLPPPAAWRGLHEVCSLATQMRRPFAQRLGVQLTHADFMADVQAWCNQLTPLECEAVAIYTEDGAAFAGMLFGAWYAGKSVVLPGDVLSSTWARVAPMVGASLGDLPGALRISSAPTSIPDAPLPPLDRNRCRLAVFTSGSTGEPVALWKSLFQLDAEMRTLQAAFGHLLDADGQPTLVTSTVSHQHIYGLLFVVLWSLAAGRPFLAERLDHLEALSASTTTGSCCLVASPAHLSRLPMVPGWPDMLGRLAAVFSSGGPLAPEAAEDSLRKLGRSPLEVFGSSETGGIAWRQRSAHGDHWTPLPGIEWRLEDGLLQVRSDHLPNNDWLTTTDQARALPNGGFVLQGRADRIVKIAEKRVSLTGIERVLTDTALITEAKALVLDDGRVAVVAVPSAEGARLLAAEGRRAVGAQLREHLLPHVPRVALPRRWRFVDRLPVTSQGKTPQALLQSLFPEPWSLIGEPMLEWLERGTEHAICSLFADAESAVFDGHFPGHPILPGVVQIDWAARLGQAAFGIAQRFMSAEHLKFRKTITPGLTVQLHLRWTPSTGKLAFVYTSEQGEHARGALLFERTDHDQGA